METDRVNQWLKFQRDTVAGVQEALADTWRCFVVANPSHPEDPPVALPAEIPDDEARATVKVSVYRSRLKDTAVADEVKAWMTDMTEAVDSSPVSPETRKDLLDRYRSLTLHLGTSVRDLYDPTVKHSK